MDVPPDPFFEARLVAAPPRLAAPLFCRPLRIDPLGTSGPTPGQARGHGFRRTGPGLVVPADALVEQPTQRVVESAALLPPGGAVTGWGSLHLAGAMYFDGSTTAGTTLRVPLLFPSYRADRPGVRFCRDALHPDEIVLRHGVPCTNVHRALLDELCLADDLREAVVLIDMVMYAELTSLKLFGAYLDQVPKRRGLRLARKAFALAIEGAESPRETLMRLIWILDALLPPSLSNRSVYAVGRRFRFLGRPDLLSPETGAVGEYDGERHRETRRRSKDIGREGRLRGHGLEYFSFVAGELNNREAAAGRMIATVDRARRSAFPRLWTLESAATTWSLDERIELRESMLDGEQRARLLHDRPSAPPVRGIS